MQGAAWCPMGSDEQAEVSMSMGLAEASEVLGATPGGHTWWPPPPVPLISDVEGSQIKDVDGCGGMTLEIVEHGLMDILQWID